MGEIPTKKDDTFNDAEIEDGATLVATSVPFKYYDIKSHRNPWEDEFGFDEDLEPIRYGFRPPPEEVEKWIKTGINSYPQDVQEWIKKGIPKNNRNRREAMWLSSLTSSKPPPIPGKEKITQPRYNHTPDPEYEYEGRTFTFNKNQKIQHEGDPGPDNILTLKDIPKYMTKPKQFQVKRKIHYPVGLVSREKKDDSSDSDEYRDDSNMVEYDSDELYDPSDPDRIEELERRKKEEEKRKKKLEKWVEDGIANNTRNRRKAMLDSSLTGRTPPKGLGAEKVRPMYSSAFYTAPEYKYQGQTLPFKNRTQNQHIEDPGPDTPRVPRKTKKDFEDFKANQDRYRDIYNNSLNFIGVSVVIASIFFYINK